MHRNGDTNKNNLYLLHFWFWFIPGTVLDNNKMQLKATEPLEETKMYPHATYTKPTNLSIFVVLKSSVITDEPKRVLCPFQEDCLVKLDYIS